MTASRPAIELDNVTIKYGTHVAVKGVSLTVGQGEFVTLLGPSGSGKTTLLNLVAGAFAPASGKVFIQGKDVSFAPTHTRNIGMVFQSYTLFPSKTVARNVAFPLQIRGESAQRCDARVAEALKTVRLLEHADKLPAQISGGQAQRVALARAIVFEPDILLFDEPLGALDRALRKDLQREIRRIQQNINVPALYVTHDQEEAMSMSDRIVLFRDGLIVQQGSPREVYETPRSVWAATFLGEANVWPLTRVLEDRNGTLTAESEGFRFTFAPGFDSGLREGAWIISRPEDCRLSPEPLADGSSYPARIVGLEYLGAMQSVTVALDGGPTLTAITTGRGQRLAPGDVVHCSWRPGSHSIVPRD
ncbi:MAG: ABC transporter ATP-binding protein [Paracoccus sp. (in: a-proteobacteria)]|uniref:ABC transporter ATP-binding protein n=1 Tax=Paracoccus sp. TaxID=267 RepID=UPI0039E4DAB9